jgi:ATP-dependent helicase HrpB
VVLDEFHERHIETDLLLLLLRRLRAGPRPDLELLVMSATLESDAVAAYLGGAARLKSAGRQFSVNVAHLPQPDDRPLEKQVASAVRSLSRDHTGDLLVFLPGAREIVKASEALEKLAKERDLAVLPLHGDLPIAEQAAAIEKGTRQKVVLSTNVAESSVTVEGVVAVVDSGQARVAGHSAWTGMRSLTTSKISRASAIQRAGRAGRTQAGWVMRLYTKGDFDNRPAHMDPEIVRSDLAETLLLLKQNGVNDTSEASWLSPPPAASIAAAESLLKLLGAVHEDGQLSDIGKRLLQIPLHPRLARILVEGERRGVERDAALIAALLSVRDIRRTVRSQFRRGRGSSGASGPSDVLELLELYREAEASDFRNERLRSLELDGSTVRRITRAERQLLSLARSDVPPPENAEASEQALLACILCGFADRLARRRQPEGRELILAGGSVAKLSEQSVVHRPMLMVVLDIDEHPGRPAQARLASAVHENTLYELFADRVSMHDDVLWNSQKERAEQQSSIRWGAVVLEESRQSAQAGNSCAQLLEQKANERPERFLRSDPAQKLAARLALLKRRDPEVPDAQQLLR